MSIAKSQRKAQEWRQSREVARPSKAQKKAAAWRERQAAREASGVLPPSGFGTAAHRRFLENKRRIEAASSQGTASEATLAERSYSVSPDRGRPRAPAEAVTRPKKRRRRRRNRS